MARVKSSGYLAGLSCPSMTLSTASRSCSPMSNSAGHTRLPTFSTKTRSSSSSGAHAVRPAPGPRPNGRHAPGLELAHRDMQGRDPLGVIDRGDVSLQHCEGSAFRSSGITCSRKCSCPTGPAHHVSQVHSVLVQQLTDLASGDAVLFMHIAKYSNVHRYLLAYKWRWTLPPFPCLPKNRFAMSHSLGSTGPTPMSRRARRRSAIDPHRLHRDP